MYTVPRINGIPRVDMSAGQSFTVAMNGHCVHMLTVGAYNIQSNALLALPRGVAINFYNPGAASTITITTDTLVLAGVGTPGTRTVAQFGFGIIWKDDTTVWVCAGQGVT